ncbi:MAG: HAMP domain-containing sensor histidine kinase [Eubacterium sp.]
MILIIGYGIIFIQLWKKTLGYIGEIVQGVENTYGSEKDQIELSSDLKEIEVILNKNKKDLEQSRHVAEEAEKKKNDLIVYLAHDLRTPLSSILGYLFLLKNETAISKETQLHYLEIVYGKAERLELLIDELFDIARFQISNMPLMKNKTNLTRFVEQLASEFRPMLDEKSINCDLSLEKDVFIVCDCDKLGRAFDNILRNAISYSYEKSTIKITLHKKTEEIEVTFENSCETIPDYQLEHIFEQFYRVDPSRNTQSGGAGLGLAIAKEIIEVHGGQITASSSHQTMRLKIHLPMV